MKQDKAEQIVDALEKLVEGMIEDARPGDPNDSMAGMHYYLQRDEAKEQLLELLSDERKD